MIFQNLTPLEEDSTVEKKIQWLKTHNHFCAKPFHTLQLEINPNGQLISSPCCNYSGDIGLSSLDQQFSIIKADVANGIPHKKCHRCWDTEKSNDYSERIRDLIYWPVDSVNKFLNTAQVSEFNIGIKFSNFCNLACRSCGPLLSSTYAQIKNQSVPLAVSTDISEDSTTWPEILDYTKKLTETYELVRVGLIGGETMLQRGAEQYIDYLASLPNSNNVVIALTSNFTTLNDKLFKQISHFRRFDLTASIDSVGPNYHYVRWPAQFSKIQQNIDNYIEIRKNTLTLTTFTIASVWSLNNIFYINEYLDFLLDCLKKQPDLIVHILHLDRPPPIAIENLPVKYRSALLSYIQSALAHPVINYANALPMKIFLEGVESFLNSTVVVQDLFDNFLKFTADFDRRTNCEFEKFNSRFYQILSDVDQNTYKNYLL
jgi:hypothetical protein